MMRSSKSVKVKKEAATCRSEYTAKNSKVTLRPFTSPQDLALRTTSVKGQERDSNGFAVVTIKKKSSKPTTYLPQRQTWSREPERAQLQGLGLERSRALVGGTLSHTDTSNWCSSLSARDTSLTAFTEDEEEQFTVPKSVGKVVCQQLDHGNVVRVCTSRSIRNEEFSAIDVEREDEASNELAPLSFLDELERKGAKILTPRSLSAYTPLPIVSETYPVLCGKDEYMHRPFSSSGFHTLSSSQRPTSRTIHTAIVHITESLQAEAIVRKRREREKAKRLEAEALQNKICQTHTVSFKVLPSERTTAKDTDLGSGSHKNLSAPPTTPPPSAKSPCELPKATSIWTLATPTQRQGSSKAVGPVVNGLNPNKADTPVSTKESFRPLLTLSKKTLTLSTCNNIHRGPTNSQRNKRNFLFISRHQANNMRNMTQVVSSKRQPNKEPQSHSVSFGAVEDRSQRATNSPFNQEQVINIPTADSLP
ncbi:uncharacterized protein LOC115358184 isoform X2 [Myripristis murdjan]|nr:uncharacterized protein LOC115358184 isoform X2 [Myripristis murdjan]XP_029905903.1 uncharacterized protein LOC115358184 isoform X2 [Myripristis murdjan]